MDFEKIKTSDLIPADYNPRFMQPEEIQKLKKNMNTFGLVDPIIINLKNNHIIGGHQRFNILKKDVKELNLLRLGDIGWAFHETDLKLEDEAKEKALNLSLNKLDGEFDEEKLNNLFKELTKTNIDLDLTGFNDIEILDIEVNNINLDLQAPDVEDEDLLEMNTEIPGTEYTYNIKLYNEVQKEKLTQLITTLKSRNPNKEISKLIIEYLQKNIKNKNKNISPYTLIFDNEQEYNTFKQLIDEVNTNYKQDNFINFIDSL